MTGQTMGRSCRGWIGLRQPFDWAWLLLIVAGPASADSLIEFAELRADNLVAQAGVGGSVDLHGSFLVLGAPDEPVDAQAARGAVYVFQKSGSQWMQTARVIAPDGASGDRFGAAVAIRSGELLVGAPGADTVSTQNSGAGYVFSLNPLPLAPAVIFQFKLVVPDGERFDDDGLGESVDLLTQQVDGARHYLLGAPNGDRFGAEFNFVSHERSGYAYCFSGASPQIKRGPPSSDAAAGMRFGASLAFASDSFVVGAPHAAVGLDGSGTQDVGAMFHFAGRNCLGAFSTKISPVGAQSGDEFGRAVAGAAVGDLVVGAPGTGGGLGAAHLYRRNGGQWLAQQALSVPGLAAGDRYGDAVAIGPKRIIVAAPRTGAATGNGRAHSFVLDAGAWLGEGELPRSLPQITDRFGHALAIDEVNGRVLVGLPARTGPAPQLLAAAGASVVYEPDSLADMAITLTNGTHYTPPGSEVVAHLVIDNHGPGAAVAAEVAMAMTGQYAGVSWACVAALNGATCPTLDSGSGDLQVTFDLAAAGRLMFDAVLHVDPGNLDEELISFQAGVSVVPTNIDPAPNNNYATDDDLLGPFRSGFEAGEPTE